MDEHTVLHFCLFPKTLNLFYDGTLKLSCVKCEKFSTELQSNDFEDNIVQIIRKWISIKEIITVSSTLSLKKKEHTFLQFCLFSDTLAMLCNGFLKLSSMKFYYYGQNNKLTKSEDIIAYVRSETWISELKQFINTVIQMNDKV